MALRLYNTVSKEKELFEPVNPGKVGIYVCGPTVYKPSHIGHAVGPVIFDALKKYLTFKGYQVTLVVNITDVDDKMIIEAANRGISVAELADEVSASYFEAMNLLGVDSIDMFPRATAHIEDMFDLIRKLMAKDAAYAVDGDVWFDVSKCRDYGKLSHRKTDDQLSGTRKLASESKRNPGDFALWKKAQPDEIGWQSPWGYGRPGWHIECSAMSMKILGETFDIHGGGMDLVFPHHENEIAQSETATGCVAAKYWMHNGLTRVKTKSASGEWQNEKMSKSLGNVKTLKELFVEYDPKLVRFFLLSTHYRRPIDFSAEALDAVQKGMMNLLRTIERVGRITKTDIFKLGCDLSLLESKAQDRDREMVKEAGQAQLKYLEALDDDFNTAGALAVLFQYSTMLNRYIDHNQLEGSCDDNARIVLAQLGAMITSLGRVIGVLTGPLNSAANDNNGLVDQLMQIFIELRAQARKDKNWALADAIRDKLKAVAISIEDRPEGAVWQQTK
ncbi:MAG: cysteine--tRNA ligase [Sedimentisphaerales bacterium]|nr:cysteine--tRNA ligase [Sedimentisphaerales bacterium]MBN2844218.1 cysteine--tRNA ligase [Sedimentisphaerales bacterium]